MAFGTFDIFHKGHESYLKQAKKLGNYLIVVVARDKTVLKVKKYGSLNNEEKRLKFLSETGLADEVILGSLTDKYTAIKKYAPAIIALGYDQKTDRVALKNKLKEFKIKSKIVRLKAYKPEIYKSSKLRVSFQN